MFLPGLCLEEVSTAVVQQAGRPVQESQIQAGHMSLGRWQPDIVSISFVKKKISIGPMSVSPPLRLLAGSPQWDPWSEDSVL